MDLPPVQLAQDILRRLDQTLLAAETAVKPLEMPPYRGQLFELFVEAYRGGFLRDEIEDPRVDLGADNLTKLLAERWDLTTATRESHNSQSKLSPEHLGKMRLLWSFLRLWMEWTYAWNRWPEFHPAEIE